MSKHVNSHHRAAHPEFLIDTAAYQGVSREFEVVQELVAKQLLRDQSLHDQLTTDVPIRCAIESLFERRVRLEIVIAGWIDRVVLEFHASLQGDNRCLPKMLAKLTECLPSRPKRRHLFLLGRH